MFDDFIIGPQSDENIPDDDYLVFLLHGILTF